MSSLDDPVEVYRRLRADPELLERVGNATEDELALQKELRATHPDAVVRAALALVESRRRAAAKFSRVAEMWFDRIGLEQATPEAVAAHKAKRFAAALDGGDGIVHDYCTGIGADAIGLAAAEVPVASFELDPLRAEFARWNAEAYGVSELVSVRVADVTAIADREALLHVDPDRRATSSGRRTIRIEEMTPDLEQLRTWMDEFPGGAIKLSPASNFQDKFRDAEIELVSLNGECKEATIWFGSLAGAEPFRATVLPEGATLAGDPLSAYSPPGPLGQFLYDPDPAIVRAGLVDTLAESTGLGRLDAAEEYLTSDELVASPFTRAFRVLAEVSNNNREIRRAVRAVGFGQVEVKCRHVRIDADGIRRKLPLEGTEPGVVVFARINGRTRVVIARRAD